MTNQEFSNEFDILYNNIMSNQAPGLNEYEKSVFLTKAQDEIIKNYFNPKGNKYQEGFDDSAKRQIDFSALIKTELCDKVENTSVQKLFDNAGFYAMPEDIMLCLNEFVNVTRNNNTMKLVVIPLKYEDFTVLMSKPYTRPLKNQAWKLITDSINDGANNKSIKAVQIIPGPNDSISSYLIRYVRRPKPIILEDLSAYNVSIGGDEQEKTPCELDESLHPEILQRAVELAKAAYIGDINTTIEVGKRSE